MEPKGSENLECTSVKMWLVSQGAVREVYL